MQPPMQPLMQPSMQQPMHAPMQPPMQKPMQPPMQSPMQQPMQQPMQSSMQPPMQPSPELLYYHHAGPYRAQDFPAYGVAGPQPCAFVDWARDECYLEDESVDLLRGTAWEFGAFIANVTMTVACFAREMAVLAAQSDTAKAIKAEVVAYCRSGRATEDFKRCAGQAAQLAKTVPTHSVHIYRALARSQLARGLPASWDAISSSCRPTPRSHGSGNSDAPDSSIGDIQEPTRQRLNSIKELETDLPLNHAPNSSTYSFEESEKELQE
eukprot:GHVT01055005.1.p1 GENE.GHVT01055005.1~~GHVT01055005.1.p1  ORF type:complete len:267 (-),score=47.76 GHVT01055005.1:5-805(-)